MRFVQIWSGNDNGFPRRNWDSHEDVERDHGPLADGMARGAAALIKDLEAARPARRHDRPLDDRVRPDAVVARRQGPRPQPVRLHQLAGRRRHQGRHQHGPSDEWGYKPLDRDNPTQVYDIHATVLHLLGIDHTRLTVRHNGIDRRLTDVHGDVIQELIA